MTDGQEETYLHLLTKKKNDCKWKKKQILLNIEQLKKQNIGIYFHNNKTDGAIFIINFFNSGKLY